MKTSSLVILFLTDQFLDFTKNRITTFYEGGDRPVAHLDVTNPYCPELRDVLQKVGTEQGLTIHNGGTYVCTEGPRFETPAEIKNVPYAWWGYSRHDKCT